MAKGYNSRNMRGMGGVDKNMLRQAQKMSADMQKNQTNLQNREYSAQSGGGTVKVVVTGQHRLKSIVIDPEALSPEDVELIQDMVLTAVNDAMNQADQDAAETMNRITGGLNLGNLGL
ncbi:MAG: YbaB/EbfC family nucleoid-associated protein [Clostridiales bacterium]|nr:YbaB/EbfC family nucleoid-associated protein [Clostridiales bacterium]